MVVMLFSVTLLTTWMAFAVTIKRFHDRDKSGFWCLIVFVPLIGPLWQLVECGFLSGSDGSNRFGARGGPGGEDLPTALTLAPPTRGQNSTGWRRQLLPPARTRADQGDRVRRRLAAAPADRSYSSGLGSGNVSAAAPAYHSRIAGIASMAST